MNKLTKVGCSALCGSLAAISAANAGDLSVTGGADITYLSHGTPVNGNPIGMASAVSFTGTGELDNGWGVKLSIAGADAGGFSNTNIFMILLVSWGPLGVGAAARGPTSGVLVKPHFGT